MTTVYRLFEQVYTARTTTHASSSNSIFFARCIAKWVFSNSTLISLRSESDGREIPSGISRPGWAQKSKLRYPDTSKAQSSRYVCHWVSCFIPKSSRRCSATALMFASFCFFRHWMLCGCAYVTDHQLSEHRPLCSDSGIIHNRC